MKTLLIFVGIIIIFMSIVCSGIGCYGRKRYREGHKEGYQKGYDVRYLQMVREQMSRSEEFQIKYETYISTPILNSPSLNYEPFEIGATQVWSIYMEKGEGEVLYNKNKTIKYTEINSYAD